MVDEVGDAAGGGVPGRDGLDAGKPARSTTIIELKQPHRRRLPDRRASTTFNFVCPPRGDHTGVFSQYQPAYAQHRMSTFPCSTTQKKPLVRNYLKMGLGASNAL